MSGLAGVLSGDIILAIAALVTAVSGAIFTAVKIPRQRRSGDVQDEVGLVGAQDIVIENLREEVGRVRQEMDVRLRAEAAECDRRITAMEATHSRELSQIRRSMQRQIDALRSRLDA